VGQHSETAAFRVGKPQAATSKVSFEDAIFLLEIGDDGLLVTIDPASNHGDQDVQDHEFLGLKAVT
jgi:hypothetical protein